jgi:PAS domain S-box-containing protein
MRFRVAVSALSLVLCIFATYYFLIVLKTSIVYTQLFYIPVVLTCAWWGRKGIIMASSLIIFLLFVNFFFATHISIVDNLARSTILLTVSVITSALFVSRKKTEEKLWKSEQRWATTLASVGDAVIATNTAGEITFMNAEAEKLTGYTLNEASNKPLKTVFKIINEWTREEVDNPISKAFETGKAVGLADHTILVNKNGTEVAIDDSAAPIRIDEGKIIGVVLVFRDISERRRAEKELTDLKDFNEGIVESISEALLVIDPKDYRIIAANSEASRELNLRKEDLIGKTCYEATHNSSTPCMSPHNCPLQEVLVTGKVATANHIHFDKDQNRLDVEISVYPFLENEGEITKVIHITRNVTERKKAEEALMDSEAKYRALVENADDAILLTDLSGKSIYKNRAYLKNLGFEEGEEAQAEKVAKIHPDDLFSVKDKGRELFKTGYSTSEYRVKHHNGSWVYRHARSTLIYDARRQPYAILSIIRDITERKKSDETIKFQADLLNHVGQAIIMVDNNRTIRFWNKVAEKLYGWSEEQAVGHKVNELLGGTSPDEADEVTKRLMAGESWSTEVLAKNRDGSVVPVILNRTPIFKEDEEFVGAASITTDITLQKKSEADLTFSLNSLSNSLDKIQELNEKLRVVGSLTRHDVRNKLSAVTGYAYILKKKHGDQADVVDGLGKMEQAVKEIVRIFDFAKMYEQIGAEELTYINVEEKLNEAAALFSGSTPTIMNECHGLTVLADSFLRQLFFNFIDNTRKYGKKTTTIRVYFEKANQESLKLVYEDDGVGVPLENKPRLFKEGFSTGGSTGFGLFLTKKMMDVYGWITQEVGEAGKGAKFVITIPKLDKNGKENYRIVP